MAKQTEYKPDPNKFDLRTHIWDGQGHLVKKNLYTCHVIEGRSYYERPINSGNLWFENNQPAGRVEYKDGIKSINPKAEHIDYVPKLEGAEAVYAELAAVKAELEAIKAEKEPAAPKAEPAELSLKKGK